MSEEEREKRPDAPKKTPAPDGGGEEAKPKVEKPPWLVDPVVPEWLDQEDQALVMALREAHPDAIESARSYAGDLTLWIKRESVAEVARSLKEDHGFTYMVDVAGADYPDRDERFEVIYHAYCLDTEERVRMKVSTDEETPVPSVSGVWPGANWPEREAYDMYGIKFSDHPDLTRILLWEGFNGHPLRKDFPVGGIDTGSAIYPEYYDDEQGPRGDKGTGWKLPEPPQPPEPPAEAEGASGESPDEQS